MTGEPRRAILAAVLWGVFALVLGNVIFDDGVRMTASRYLVARTPYLHGQGRPGEMASAMHAGTAVSLHRAITIAAPCLLVSVVLVGVAVRHYRWD